MRPSCFALVTLLLVSITGCGDYEADDLSRSQLRRWTGDFVKIQFRRDALGAGRDLPIDPTTDSINGAEVTLAGRLSRVEGSAILLIDSSEKTVWIPRDVILTVTHQP
ncbi:MAG: hypothetical protein AAGF31_09965 [Planctomycetota bacterium]